MRGDTRPSGIPEDWEYYRNQLPVTLEERLFGPLKYGSEPLTSVEFVGHDRMRRLLASIKSAAYRTYPEYPWVTTESISSLIQDERKGTWSGYENVAAVNNFPASDHGLLFLSLSSHSMAASADGRATPEPTQHGHLSSGMIIILIVGLP